MAENVVMDLKINIQDLESFKDLVLALGAWAEEARFRDDLTEAETNLLSAAYEQK
ncbi:hypothetical protein [Planktotalea sp.]|uniref:hypothetical protein n=1 Tax=Planktotalea sp. TaxID=2029877 RepID=UPI003D6A66A7